MPNVCFVASPLTARSGVYRSSREIVAEARSRGLEWSLVLGVSDGARGEKPAHDPYWIDEHSAEPAGIRGVQTLSRRLQTHPLVVDADLVVSLLPQTDMALSLTSRKWVAYLRGLPWPDAGESSRLRATLWRTLERTALRRSASVWSTTDILRDQAALSRDVEVVPAGITQIPRQWDGRGERSTFVWAARFDSDKNPDLFLQMMRGVDARGTMYGSGPEEGRLQRDAPGNVSVGGWVAPGELWGDALAYVGTSHREAFGRSAVEAAMSGTPVVLSSAFGAAPLLITDPELQRRFVLSPHDPAHWSKALTAIRTDEQLRVALSQHVFENASQLTMQASVDRIAEQVEKTLYFKGTSAGAR